MRIVVLGANGQLGMDVVEVLSGDSTLDIVPMQRAELDVTSLTAFPNAASVLDNLSFDLLINCTSHHKTDECEDTPTHTFHVNAVGVGELAKRCQSKGATLMHVSTDYVFGGDKGAPYLESDLPNPINTYGASKMAGEAMAFAYCDKTYVLRVSSLFGRAGSSGKGGNFVETMLRVAAQGKSLRVIDDQVMSPTHTLDIARAMHALVSQHAEYGLYHCSGEGECSWYEFANAIFELTGIDADLAPVQHTEFPTKARRPAYSVLSNAKLTKYHQMPIWQSALKEYLERKGHMSPVN